MMVFGLRVGRPSDLPFVVDSWVKRGHERGERLRDATARVREILAAAESALRIAHVPDDDDAILGWAVVTGEPPVLRFVYVRRDARKQGIAKALLTGVENPRG